MTHHEEALRVGIDELRIHTHYGRSQAMPVELFRELSAVLSGTWGQLSIEQVDNILELIPFDKVE